jgi:hypothetical protein
MNHAELVDRAVRWLRGTKKCKVVLAEFVTLDLPEVPDAIGWSHAGWSVLVECKTSRSDFKADAKKYGHRLPEYGVGHERWYMTPPGLLDIGELPDRWGLVEVHQTQCRVKMRPPSAHRYRSDVSMRREMQMLISACQRHDLGVAWDSERARFASLVEHQKVLDRARMDAEQELIDDEPEAESTTVGW